MGEADRDRDTHGCSRQTHKNFNKLNGTHGHMITTCGSRGGPRTPVHDSVIYWLHRTRKTRKRRAVEATERDG